MKITTYTGGFVQTNGYLVETPDGNFLIDAPLGAAKWIADRGVRMDAVYLTHQHYDHVEDAAAFNEFGIPVHAFAPCSAQLTLEAAARGWGLPIKLRPYRVDRIFKLDSPLRAAGMKISLAHVPGHSTDSVTLYFPDHAVLFSGDTLFAGSIGRTDLPDGSTSQLLDGIAKHLMTLPPATRVFPGHGPPTTIAAEASGNPYLD